MINPNTGTVYSEVPVVHIQEELIPSEGSSIHEDGRLYDNGQVSPGSRILQNPVLSQGRPLYTGVREGFNRPLGASIQNYEAVQAGSIEGSTYQVDPTAGLSQRDARTVERHLPEAFEGTGQQGQVITTTESVYTYPAEQAVYNGIPENVTTSTYYAGQVVGNPQILVSGPIGMETVERRFAETTLSEIPVADPLGQHMRDSTNMGRVSASPTTRWELQQSDLSNARYQNHQTFENWEVNRNVFVSDRLNVMDDLLAGMERKLEWLEIGVQKVILFFKEREAQEHEYSKKIRRSLPQLGEHFESIGQTESMYDFSRGMKESDAFHAKETRNSEILANFIKKDILDWILVPSEKNYKLQANSLRTPLYAHRKRLDHLSSKRSKAYNKYFKLYDTLQKNPKPSQKESNIFKRQLKYSLAAREELRLLKLYSEQGLIVISEFTTLSSNRLLEVQRAFSLYIQKYTELNQNTVSPPEQFLDLIERANGVDGIRVLFLPNALMSIANYDFLRNKLTKPELSYLDLQQYLVYFPESVDPARSSFILKEWNAVKEGNVLRKPRACTVIATVSNNLLIVEKKHEEEELGKVKNPLQLRLTKVDGIEAGHDGYGTTVNVVERRPGTLFTHKTKAKLRFETQEEASQFLQYVNNQTAQLTSEVIPMNNQSGFIGGETTPVNQLDMAAQQYVQANNQSGLIGQQYTPVRTQIGATSGQYIPVSNQIGTTSGQYIPVSNQSGLIGSQVYPVNSQLSQVGGQVIQTGTINNQFGQIGGEL